MNLRQIRKRAIEAKSHYHAGNPNKMNYVVYFKQPNGLKSEAVVGASSRNQAIKYAKEHMIKVAGGNKDVVKDNSIYALKYYQSFPIKLINKPKNQQDRRFYANNYGNDYGKIRGTQSELGYGD